MAYVESLNAGIKPLYYNTENNNIQNTGNISDESIFLAANTNIATAPKEDKEDGGFFDAVKGIFSGIGNFFSGIFKGIGNFFKGLFSKEDKTETKDDEIDTDNETNNIKNEENDIKEDDTKKYEGVPDDIVKDWKPLLDELGGDLYYNDDVKLILELNIQNDKDVEFWGSLGIVQGDYYNEDGQRVLAINVRDWEHPLDTDLATRNGEIEATRQGKTGDCWLLSGVNSLSYTEKGREIIKNALEYQENGAIVHLNGAKDYTITDKEIENARLSGKYSSGDDDMLILELASERAIADIENGDIKLPTDLQKYYDKKEDGTLDGGTGNIIYYLFTGKEGEVYTQHNDFIVDTILDGDYSNETKQALYETTMDSALEKFEANNNKDYAMSISLGENPITVEDINGNKVKLDAPHAYALKGIDGNAVTITNPHNSGIDIELPKDTVLDTFDAFYDLDLSKN